MPAAFLAEGEGGQMAECVFCKIVSGEVPAAVLIETEKVTSFLDVSPVNPGHALVVPKRHVHSLISLSQDELHTAMFLAKRIASALLETTPSTAFNILQNDGAAAGQLIDHVHFHVIPRHEGDGFEFGWRQLGYEAGELQALQQAIQRLL
jgi:histidine triad (HIT) family protein